MRRSARGFKLRGKLMKIYKWITTKAWRRRKTLLMEHAPRKNRISPMAMTTRSVLSLARCLQRGARQLKYCCFRPRLFHGKPRGYVPLEQDPGSAGSGKTRPGSGCCGIPKGHLAVYVGESQDETQRYLVPVIYFNHPLFGELLKEAERVFGFNHPGRITIPCGPSEFEKVQMRIASGRSRGGE
uniref:Small auxin up regulated protein n=1 Tax=Boehmeria nivea TaxID=83906 RepID=A0A172J249_BOENI|nr:small auxin up regulated protein [Boehmeria nivea]